MSSINTNTDQNLDDDLNQKGPTHKLLSMAQSGQLLEIYTEKQYDLLHTFATLILSNIVGKRDWNKRSHIQHLRKFVTASDEAFAIVCLENNAFKWEEEYYDPNIPKKERIKSKWSEGENGQAKYWRAEGMMRFMNIQKTLETFRNDNELDYLEIENEMLRREKVKNDGNKRKRRKVVNEDGVTIGNEMNGGPNNNDELEEFLKRCV